MSGCVGFRCWGCRVLVGWFVGHVAVDGFGLPLWWDRDVLGAVREVVEVREFVVVWGDEYLECPVGLVAVFPSDPCLGLVLYG